MRHNTHVENEIALLRQERERREARLHRALNNLLAEPASSNEPLAAPRGQKKLVARRGPRAAQDVSSPQLPAREAAEEDFTSLSYLSQQPLLHPLSPLSLPTDSPEAVPSPVLLAPLTQLLRVDGLHSVGGGGGGNGEFGGALSVDGGISGVGGGSIAGLVGLFGGGMSSAASAASTIATSCSLARREITGEIVLDLEQWETRQRVRRWLAEENRASQVLDILERSPPAFRAALTAVLERLLCSEDDDQEPGVTMLGAAAAGAAQLVPSYAAAAPLQFALTDASSSSSLPSSSLPSSSSTLVPALQLPGGGGGHTSARSSVGVSGALRISLSSRNGGADSYVTGVNFEEKPNSRRASNGSSGRTSRRRSDGWSDASGGVYV